MAQTDQQLVQIGKLVRIRLFVHAVGERQFIFLREGSDTPVCRQHEFFYQSFGVAALARLYVHGVSGGIKLKVRFGKVELDTAVGDAFFSERFCETVHRYERIPQSLRNV